MAAGAAAVAQAIKASGVVVRVKPEEFTKILARAPQPLVIVAQGGFFSTSYQYLTSYKGLAFYCQASEQLQLPADAEVVNAAKFWIP